MTRSREIVVSDASELAAELDCFGNLLFLAAGVYSGDFVAAHMIEGYAGIHTSGPSIAMLLGALARKETSMVFTPASICDWGAPPTWDPVAVTQDVYGLIGLLPPGRPRRMFARKLFDSFPPRLRRKTDFRAIIDDLATGPEAIDAAVNRYRFAAGLQPVFALPLVLAWLARATAPFGTRALVRALLRAGLAPKPTVSSSAV